MKPFTRDCSDGDIHPNTSQHIRSTHYGMGTVITHLIYGSRAEEALVAVCGEITRLEGLFSRFLPGSDIYRMNRSAGKRWEKVRPETLEVLSKVAEISRNCPGCLDVTIGPLVDLWNSCHQVGILPDESSIHRALDMVDYRDIYLDAWSFSAGLRRRGQSVDLGAVGKGYTGDRIRDVLRELGIASACSNLGGNVVVLGKKPDGSSWSVGIQHPRREDALIGAVDVSDRTVATAGDYQRNIIDSNGKRLHHILDPLTGHPSQSGLISVTVVAEDSLTADALSTVLFITGMERGLAYLRNFPGVDAVFVDSDLRVFVTYGLRSRFRTDKDIEILILERKGKEK